MVVERAAIVLGMGWRRLAAFAERVLEDVTVIRGHGSTEETGGGKRLRREGHGR